VHLVGFTIKIRNCCCLFPYLYLTFFDVTTNSIENSYTQLTKVSYVRGTRRFITVLASFLPSPTRTRFRYKWIQPTSSSLICAFLQKDSSWNISTKLLNAFLIVSYLPLLQHISFISSCLTYGCCHKERTFYFMLLIIFFALLVSVDVYKVES